MPEPSTNHHQVVELLNTQNGCVVLSDLPDRSTVVAHVPVTLINTDMGTKALRVNQPDREALRTHMRRTGGAICPIVLAHIEGRYQLIDGYARYQAETESGATVLLTLVRTDIQTTRDINLLATALNSLRVNLVDADIFNLIDRGASLEDVMAATGKSRSTVERMFAVRAISELREAVVTGFWSVSQGANLVKAAGDSSELKQALAHRVRRLLDDAQAQISDTRAEIARQGAQKASRRQQRDLKMATYGNRVKLDVLEKSLQSGDDGIELLGGQSVLRYDANTNASARVDIPLNIRDHETKLIAENLTKEWEDWTDSDFQSALESLPFLQGLFEYKREEARLEQRKRDALRALEGESDIEAVEPRDEVEQDAEFPVVNE